MPSDADRGGGCDVGFPADELWERIALIGLDEPLGDRERLEALAELAAFGNRDGFREALPYVMIFFWDGRGRGSLCAACPEPMTNTDRAYLCIIWGWDNVRGCCCSLMGSAVLMPYLQAMNSERNMVACLEVKVKLNEHLLSRHCCIGSFRALRSRPTRTYDRI